MSHVISTLESDPTLQEKDGQGRLPGRYLRFGTFELDVIKRELSRSGSRVTLGNSVYQTLLLFLQNPDAIITREAIRMRLWPKGCSANHDKVVTTIVNQLRQVLADTHRERSLIMTIPLKGYSFIAKVEAANQPIVRNATRRVPKMIWATLLRLPSNEKPSGSKPCTIWSIARIVGLFVAAVLLGAVLTLLSR